MKVHEMTRTFRQLLDSMAKPGTINEVLGSTHHTSLFDSTYLLVETLLDNEVYCTLLSKDEKDKEEFALILNVKMCDEAADFIVVAHDFSRDDAASVLEDSKVGTFIDPDRSATWIIEVDGFEEGTCYQLSGPGIQTTNIIQLKNMDEVLKVRNVLCSEFPLGVDVIFVSRNRLMAIPRTTLIEEVV